jgi:hypothetical protein
MAGARSATAFAPSSRIRLISPRLTAAGAKELHKRDVKLLKSLERVNFCAGRDARPDFGDAERQRLDEANAAKAAVDEHGLKVAQA